MRFSSYIPHKYSNGSYAFGSAVKERTASFTQKYRFGFNNQEQEIELGEYYSFEYRVHDARLGRFLSVDPLETDYPFYSSYQFAGNMVIQYVELEGLEPALPKTTEFATELAQEKAFPGYSFIKTFLEKVPAVASAVICPVANAFNGGGSDMTKRVFQYNYYTFKFTASGWDATGHYENTQTKLDLLDNTISTATVGISHPVNDVISGGMALYRDLNYPANPSTVNDVNTHGYRSFIEVFAEIQEQSRQAVIKANIERDRQVHNIRNSLNSNNTHIIVGDGVNIRTAPNKNSLSIGMAFKNYGVTVTGVAQDGYVEVKFNDGTVGWVANQFTSEIKSDSSPELSQMSDTEKARTKSSSNNTN